MLQWISQFLERRRLAKRALFAYHDGTRRRYGDPFALFRVLYNDPQVNVATTLDFAEQGREPEATEFLDLIARTFGVQRWDGRVGLTDWELMALFGAFTNYLDGLKKNSSLGVTSSKPTDSGFSISEAPPEDLTSSCSDCG